MRQDVADRGREGEIGPTRGRPWPKEALACVLMVGRALLAELLGSFSLRAVGAASGRDALLGSVLADLCGTWLAGALLCRVLLGLEALSLGRRLLVTCRPAARLLGRLLGLAPYLGFPRAATRATDVLLLRFAGRGRLGADVFRPSVWIVGSRHRLTAGKWFAGSGASSLCPGGAARPHCRYRAR